LDTNNTASHALIAVAFIAVIIGHIYIGTSAPRVPSRSVDLNWAKGHHGKWLEEEIAKGSVPQQVASVSPAE